MLLDVIVFVYQSSFLSLETTSGRTYSLRKLANPWSSGCHGNGRRDTFAHRFLEKSARRFNSRHVTEKVRWGRVLASKYRSAGAR
eukprot:scaffold1484_cov173-Amphora_coffeaeformis.AAC.18